MSNHRLQPRSTSKPNTLEKKEEEISSIFPLVSIGRHKKLSLPRPKVFLLINRYRTRKQQSRLTSLYLQVSRHHVCVWKTQISVPAAKMNIRRKHHMLITYFCLVIFLHNYASLKRKFRASKQPAYMKRHAHSGNAMKWKMDASGTFKASFSKCQKSH